MIELQWVVLLVSALFLSIGYIIHDKNKVVYWKPSVTVDLAVVTKHMGEDCVLLIERGNDPYKGCYAMPGGFFDETDESTKSGACRELREEVSIDIHPHKLDVLDVLDAIGRDPRGRVISHVFSADYRHTDSTDPIFSNLRADSDAKSYKWIPINKLHSIGIAFDHMIVLSKLIEKMDDISFLRSTKNKKEG